jgi:hypothetical protein
VGLRWAEEKGKEVGMADLDTRDLESVKDVEPADKRFKGEQVVVFGDEAFQRSSRFIVQHAGCSSCGRHREQVLSGSPTSGPDPRVMRETSRFGRALMRNFNAKVI